MVKTTVEKLDVKKKIQGAVEVFGGVVVNHL